MKKMKTHTEDPPERDVTKRSAAEKTEPADDAMGAVETTAEQLDFSAVEMTEEELDFSAIETPEELRPHEGAPGEDAAEDAAVADAVADDAPPAAPLPAPLDRERPAREPLIARVWWVVGAIVLAAAVIAAGAFVLTNAQSRTTVPGVIGRSVGEAQAAIAQAGLTSRVVENRFSTEPVGRVLEQKPGAGVEMSRGEVVDLVVSAGTEEMIMPDVVGDGLTLARGILEARGLVLQVENITSEEASDTVLSTIPSPGSTVRTGDVIHVQVAAPFSGSVTLRPFNMQGLTFVIDPALVPNGAASDTPMEVSRRLRSLLEASGANVHVLRSGVVTTTPDAQRAQNARALNAVAGVGISVAATGPEGRTVTLVSDTGAPRPSLASSMVAQLTTSVPPSVEASAAPDPVLSGTTYPSVRIGLGVLSSPSDTAAFSDPRWADRVAQAIYTALGEAFGERQQP